MCEDRGLRFLSNGWLHEPEERPCERNRKRRDIVELDHFATYADVVPPDELEAMSNLCLREEEEGFYVHWDGQVFGPFNCRSPRPHVRRIDNVLTIFAGNFDAAGKFWAYIIAEGVQRGPFTQACTPRFTVGYLLDEPRPDGTHLVWRDKELGPFKMELKRAYIEDGALHYLTEGKIKWGPPEEHVVHAS